MSQNVSEMPAEISLTELKGYEEITPPHAIRPRCIENCLSLPICYIFFGLVYTIIFKYCWDSFPILVYPTKLKKTNKTKVKKQQKKGEMNDVKLCVV